MKPLARYMEETGMSVDQLIAAAGLDAKLVKAIVSGNYTPSPTERQRLSAAIGVGGLVGAAAWRKFAAYWLLIRAPSGAVRHSMLGAIARRAAG